MSKKDETNVEEIEISPEAQAFFMELTGAEDEEDLGAILALICSRHGLEAQELIDNIEGLLLDGQMSGSPH